MAFRVQQDRLSSGHADKPLEIGYDTGQAQQREVPGGSLPSLQSGLRGDRQKTFGLDSPMVHVGV